MDIAAAEIVPTSMPPNHRLRRIGQQLGGPPAADLPTPCSAAAAAAAAAAATDFPSSAAAIGVAPTTDAGLAFRQFVKHGFCILADVIPAAEIAALRESGERTARENDSHTSESTWHTGGVLNFDQSFAPWVAAPPVLRLAGHVFGTDSVRVTYTTLQINKPHCSQSRWHSDGHLSQTQTYNGSKTGLMRPAHINAVFFLSDFTPANGGTWLVPSSHEKKKSDTPQYAWSEEQQNRPRSDAVHAVGPAGACCVIDCRLWHCLPPNHTAETRAMVNVR